MTTSRLVAMATAILLTAMPSVAQRVRVVADLQGPSFDARAISDDGTVALLELDGAIVRYDLPAGTPTVLLAGGYHAPSLSDDGTVAAVSSTLDPLGLNPDGGIEVFLVSAADGSVLTQVTDFPAGTVPAGALASFQFGLSGDASLVAFAGQIDPLGTNPGMHGQVFVTIVGAATRQITAFTEGRIEAEGVAISDDGSRVAFIHRDAAADRIVYWTTSTGGGVVDVSSSIGPTPRKVAMSGDGSTIAFEENGVHTTTLAGTLAFSDPDGADPSLSDDGTLYYDVLETTHERAVMREGVAILDPPAPAVAFAPVVSGDGSALLFVTEFGSFGAVANDDGSKEVGWALTNGSVVVGLTDTPPQGEALFPAVDPGGTRVAFSVLSSSRAAIDSRSGGVYVVEPDGFGLRRVTFGAGAVDTGFSPDGESVVLLSHSNLLDTPECGTYTPTTLYRVGVDGGDLTQLGDCNVGQNQASFDVYGGGLVFDDLFQFALRNLDLAGVLLNTVVDGPEPVIRGHEPRVDDLGEWVVFKSAPQGTGEVQIWRSAADGSSGGAITGDPAWYPQNGPDISADGTRVVFDSRWDPLGTNADHNFEIFLVEYPAGTITQLTDTTTGDNLQPLLSGNGEWVWFGSSSGYFGSPGLQLFRLEIDGDLLERVQGPYTLSSSCSFLETEDSRPCYDVDHDGERGVFADWQVMLVEFDVANEWAVPTGGEGDLAWQADPRYVEYDVLRGDLAALGPGPGGTVDLGDVVCLASDLADTVVPGGDADPAPEQGFFYLYRGSQGPLDAGTWGRGSDGGERIPASGDCP